MARKKKSPNAGPQEELLTESQQAAMAVVQMRMLAAEYFDGGVLIFTREDEGKTRLVHCKFGNEFAIRGMLDTYMEEHINPELTSGEEDGDEDESENWKKSS